MDTILGQNNFDAENNSDKKPKVEAGLGLTEKWAAREAGREVAETALQQLSGKPDFFLLFSTIHYKKHGGFQEFLNGVWDVLPEGTQLVGGTVVGFMNNQGVYAHGATALAVSINDMDVAVGFGKNTKRNPRAAVRNCSMSINKNLKKSSFKNKFLLNVVSGPSVLKILGQGPKKVIDSGWMSKFITVAFGLSQYLFQKGVGREDEIFDEIVKTLSDYKMILGTSFDDYKGINNFQFINKNVVENNIVCLGFSTNLKLDIKTTHAMKKTELKFKITKLSRDKHIIHKINYRPAREELSRILNWPDGFLNEKSMALTIPYYPISLKRNGQEVPVVMPFVLKDSIATPCIIDADEVSILTVNGKDFISAMKENLHFFKNINPEFGICTTCMTILDTLGYKINIIREQMLDYFGEKPFLVFFCAGEGSYSPNQNITYANMSFNTAVFGY